MSSDLAKEYIEQNQVDLVNSAVTQNQQEIANLKEKARTVQEVYRQMSKGIYNTMQLISNWVDAGLNGKKLGNWESGTVQISADLRQQTAENIQSIIQGTEAYQDAIAAATG